MRRLVEEKRRDASRPQRKSGNGSNSSSSSSRSSSSKLWNPRRLDGLHLGQTQSSRSNQHGRVYVSNRQGSAHSRKGTIHAKKSSSSHGRPLRRRGAMRPRAPIAEFLLWVATHPRVHEKGTQGCNAGVQFKPKITDARLTAQRVLTSRISSRVMKWKEIASARWPSGVRIMRSRRWTTAFQPHDSDGRRACGRRQSGRTLKPERCGGTLVLNAQEIDSCGRG